MKNGSQLIKYFASIEMGLGIQEICHFTSRDIEYYPFYFQGYGILCSILVTFRDIEYLGKLIMAIFASLLGTLARFFQGICDIWYPPIQTSPMRLKIILANLSKTSQRANQPF